MPREREALGFPSFVAFFSLLCLKLGFSKYVWMSRAHKHARSRGDLAKLEHTAAVGKTSCQLCLHPDEFLVPPARAPAGWLAILPRGRLERKGPFSTSKAATAEDRGRPVVRRRERFVAGHGARGHEAACARET